MIQAEVYVRKVAVVDDSMLGRSCDDECGKASAIKWPVIPEKDGAVSRPSELDRRSWSGAHTPFRSPSTAFARPFIPVSVSSILSRMCSLQRADDRSRLDPGTAGGSINIRVRTPLEV
jgi:hypothetical protein